MLVGFKTCQRVEQGAVVLAFLALLPQEGGEKRAGLGLRNQQGGGAAGHRLKTPGGGQGFNRHGTLLLLQKERLSAKV